MKPLWVRRMKANTKYSGTYPERIVRKLLLELEIDFSTNEDLTTKSLEVTDKGRKWNYRPDLILYQNEKVYLVILVHGPHHNRKRQRQIDIWEYKVYASNGIRVITIDHKLTRTALGRAYLLRTLPSHLASNEYLIQLTSKEINSLEGKL